MSALPPQVDAPVTVGVTMSARVKTEKIPKRERPSGGGVLFVSALPLIALMLLEGCAISPERSAACLVGDAVRVNVSDVTFNIPEALEPSLNGTSLGPNLPSCSAQTSLEPQIEVVMAAEGLRTLSSPDLRRVSKLSVLKLRDRPFWSSTISLTTEIGSGFWRSEPQAGGKIFYIGNQQGAATTRTFVATCYGSVDDVDHAPCTASQPLTGGGHALFLFNMGDTTLPELTLVMAEVELLATSMTLKDVNK